jgi:glycine cleavage system H protein
MSNIRYTKDHEWVRLDGKTRDQSASQTMPRSSSATSSSSSCPRSARRSRPRAASSAVVESVKAASEIYAPMSGEVIEVNEALDGDPGKVNTDAEGEAWFLKLRVADDSEFDDLMDEVEYKEFLEEEQ